MIEDAEGRANLRYELQKTGTVGTAWNAQPRSEPQPKMEFTGAIRKLDLEQSQTTEQERDRGGEIVDKQEEWNSQNVGMD